MCSTAAGPAAAATATATAGSPSSRRTPSTPGRRSPSATAAANSATAAASSATTATNQASTATTKASEASTSASNASTSETNAASSASTASTKASQASTSETNAASSETNAASSASSASSSASTATTQASTATTKASEASTSATNSASSATASASSASTASTQASTATTQASNAASSASSASGSASTATTQASTATTQASTATTKASEASVSAAAALVSKLAAASSANDINVAAIDASISDTAVDVFIYDTSKDSDGGQWRKRTQGTSWYNETLNTSTRGSRKEFPSVAVIVAESNQVTIYDGDDPDMPMWASWSRYNAPSQSLTWWRDARSATSVSALNGIVTFGQEVNGDSASGLNFIAFTRDIVGRHSNHASYGGVGMDASSGVKEENLTVGSLGSIVNATVNDVAMTVLPNAPIDSTTNLPIPTIAIASDGGVSVIKDDGSVVDITYTNYEQIHHISFRDDGALVYSSDVSPNGRFIHVDYEIPNSDVSKGAGYLGVNNDEYYYNNTNNYSGRSLYLLENGYVRGIAGGAIGGTKGLNRISPSRIDDTKGSVAYITSDYSTGHMVGDIKLAALSDTDDTDVVGSTNLITAQGMDGTITGHQGSVTLSADKTYKLTITTVGSVHLNWRQDNASSTIAKSSPLGGYALPTGTSTTYITGLASFSINSWNTGTISSYAITEVTSDRSVNSKPLNVHGTITKAPVATGADLVAYSGFSSSNYLEQPYNSDLDFGAGDFSVMGWVKASDTGSSNVTIMRREGQTGLGAWRFRSRGGKASLWISDDGVTSIEEAIGTSDVDNGVWHFLVGVKSGTSNLKMYVDGALETTASLSTATGSLNSSDAALYIGNNATFNSSEPWPDSLALLRISATAPSAEQIAKIYEDEKVLFTENAKATLYGTSDAVTALAHDSDTNLLHVGTSSGRSVFSGLRRVDNTTTAVGAAISASNGLVVED